MPSFSWLELVSFHSVTNLYVPRFVRRVSCYVLHNFVSLRRTSIDPSGEKKNRRVKFAIMHNFNTYHVWDSVDVNNQEILWLFALQTLSEYSLYYVIVKIFIIFIPLNYCLFVRKSTMKWLSPLYHCIKFSQACKQKEFRIAGYNR